ncbi:MAG: DNA topoisomerase IB [Rhizobiaceae bacterium]|nr:DNA topoisomerase IB [Rhizobiaceae bacterium]
MLQNVAKVTLAYVSDQTPGITRRRSGKGFSYRTPEGGLVRDRQTLARIRALAIPPAYEHVWICVDPDGHLQAPGREARGRKQYRYHPGWSEVRGKAKFDSLAEFGAALPLIREQVDADLRRRGLPQERVLASVVWLLQQTLIRIGNDTYARDNKSYGLTTLRQRHVQLDAGKIRLRFKGKSGKQWNLQFVDRRIVGVLRSMQELPGQHLFQYVDDDGTCRTVSSDDVNLYLRATTGAEFTSKHFRTWAGTVVAATLLGKTELPQTKAATARVLNAAVDLVAARLGNTRAVCRSAYIHPRIVEDWLEGKLAAALERAARSRSGSPEGLDADEALVLRWLTT